MKRMRVARSISKPMLHHVLEAEFAKGARLEIVTGDGSRHGIARSLDPGLLRLLVDLVDAGSPSRLELVYGPDPRQDERAIEDA